MLSVVLPNFNHGKFIARALSALLCQSPQPDEIFIVDDGSTDDSLAIIEQFKDPTVHVLVNAENTGVVAALMRGLAAASGNYVYFAAADDWVMPGFFALALSMFESYPYTGLVCGEAILVDGTTGEPMGMRPIIRPKYRAGWVDPGGTRQLLRYSDNWILTGSTVFRRNAVLSAGGLHPQLGPFADGYLARKIALTHGFCFAPQIVSTWCIFPNSVSRLTALSVDKSETFLQTIPPVIDADPVFPTWYADIFRRRWRFGISRLALEMDPINRPLLMSMGAPSPLDRSVLKLILETLTPKLARLTALAWLWFRLRPIGLLRVLRTAASRRLSLPYVMAD
jgi:glycosyltransferase involved in cell wall biosynthesis